MDKKWARAAGFLLYALVIVFANLRKLQVYPQAYSPTSSQVWISSFLILLSRPNTLNKTSKNHLGTYRNFRK